MPRRAHCPSRQRSTTSNNPPHAPWWPSAAATRARPRGGSRSPARDSCGFSRAQADPHPTMRRTMIFTRPTRARIALGVAALTLLGALAACGSDDPSGPTTKVDADLNIVEQAPTAPSLTALTRTVLVTKGEDAELRLYYRARIGVADSTEFLRVRFDDNTLLTRPDGTPIADGETVLVTVTVPDPTKFLVNLEPTG